ncbi:NADP-dependent oxidoreductase [Phytomonospora endophytica]|uniref:NADPH:quinone reductase-like Zn-dependent oxidoreductase n=1 Tax=Phytomonospora endophytica TaxID=714109 RepID=A0A841F8Y8_9ACTN|nr:NADP-dependent oxidoreductase [Phytomonospora endophytica]MBB6033591.1 NADPH:quinone reductase-like Zn-dependent oxidoreductase [Phytomonospora endophytica]GIG64893.1 NADPH:quinone reductase [Phytomonospora endophytica]
MKAARIHTYGDAGVIRVEDAPTPRPGRGEVLIAVAAAAHNPSDVWFRSGLLHEMFPADFPVTLGADVSGTVVALGEGTALTVGDRVMGRLDTGGTAAEYTTAPEANLTAAPISIPLAHAAAIPVAGLTAWQAVFEQAGIRAGERVLINGAGGGVGSFGVQLARHTGATVIATAGPRSAETVRRHGAHLVVDYTTGDIAGHVGEPVDVLLNLAGIPPETAAGLGALVRPGGRIVSAATPVEAPEGVTSTHFVARNDTAQLAELAALVDAGVVTVDISDTRPLAELAEVHRAAEAGGIRGKVLLIP